MHQRLLKADEQVSLATVYRTLRLLSSLELLCELELPEGGRRFELASDEAPGPSPPSVCALRHRRI